MGDVFLGFSLHGCEAGATIALANFRAMTAEGFANSGIVAK